MPKSTFPFPSPSAAARYLLLAWLGFFGWQDHARAVDLANLRVDYDTPSSAYANGQTAAGKIPDTAGTGSWLFFARAVAAPGGAETPLVYNTAANSVRNANSFTYPAGSLNLPGISSTQLISGGAEGAPASNELALHPGDSGQSYLVLRWTVGSGEGGLATIVGTMHDLGVVGNGVTFQIFNQAGVSLFSQTTSGNTPIPFSVNQAVVAGNFIDFVIGNNGTYASDQSALSVTITGGPDTRPPVLLGAAAPTSPNTVTLTYDEAVDLSTASFSIAGGNVTGAAPGATAANVVLTVTGLAAGHAYTVVAQNVRDLAGNVAATASVSFNAVPVTFADLRGDYDAAPSPFVEGQSADGEIPDTEGSGNWLYFARDTAAPGGGETPLVYTAGSNSVRNGNAFTYTAGSLNLPGLSNFQLIADSGSLIEGVPAANELAVHPGADGQQYLVMRWTASAGEAGLVTISGAMHDLGALGNGLSFQIFNQAGASLLSQVTSGNAEIPFSIDLTVAEGDYIDFVVGNNGSYGSDQSAVRVKVSGTPKPDVTAPVLLSAVAPISPNSVTLTFSEAVDVSSASFSIAGGTVTGFALGATPKTVVLTVTGLAAGSDYSVVAQNVKDLAGNVAASTPLGFTAVPPQPPPPIGLVRPLREPMAAATRRGGLVISEIQYHPADRPDSKNLEFVEICNTLPWAEDLGGFRLTGEIAFSFPAGTSIPAGGYLVVAAAPAQVQEVYGLAGVLGPYTGALDNSGGTLRLRDYADAVIFEVTYDSAPPWPPAADGAGHSLVLARPSFGMNDPRAWDISFNLGGSPGGADPYPVDSVPDDAFPGDPYRTVMINEIQAATASPEDYIELFNLNSEPLDLGDCSLSDDRNALKYVFPAGTVIQPKGFLSVNGATLGFGLKAGGETVYFRAPGNGGAPGRVLDALRFGPQRAGTTYGRYPDGAVNFSTLRAASAGLANLAPASKEAVISEIFYHPPAGSTQPPFVEVANTSGAVLDLAGWRLRGGVDYDFPVGATVPPGGQLAVTTFSGTLNKGVGERLRLEKPVTSNDSGAVETIYASVDEVTYGTGGRWGRDSDGGGSSLERIDLRGDGRLAANWADSTESGKSSWVQLTNTDTLATYFASAPANRLEVMLLGAGEVLIDNVELVQGAGANLVPNGAFDTGGTGWTGTGTHAASTVETGVGVGGSGAMHLRATGRGDTANRLLTALSTTAVSGATYTLRAQVKYLRGNPEIVFRVHGGGMETAGNIRGAILAGTPGAANSRAVANAGPAISAVTHLPVLPSAQAPVVVYATVDDPDGVGGLTLNYRIDPSTTTIPTPMVYRGAGMYSATIPGQNSGRIAAFTIAATDAAGASANFPADAPASECLVRWGEAVLAGNNLPNYRMWISQANVNTWASRLKNSNTPLDVTFVCGDYRVIYNAGGMYSGSPFHTSGFNSPVGAACDYNVTMPSDDRFLGEQDLIWVGPGTMGDDTSQVRENIAGWVTRRMKVPALNYRYVNVFVNGSHRGQVMLDMQQPNGNLISEYFPDDDDGALHKAQDWIEFDDGGSAFDNNTLLRAVFTPFKNSVGQYKTSAYRYRWAIRSAGGSASDFSTFYKLVDAFNAGTSASDPAFFHALDPILDQDTFSGALAIQRIIGNWDTWGWTFGKNMYLYKPRNGPWVMMPWDMDLTLGLGGDPSNSPLFSDSSGDPLAVKYRAQPDFRRSYWRALLNAANGPMAAATVESRMDLYANALRQNSVPVNDSTLASVKTYIAQRRSYILSQAASVYGATSFALTGSSTISDADGVLTLAGTAPATVAAFRINGVLYTPTWTSETGWTLPLTLFASTNNLTVEALDLSGNVVGSFPVTINVTGPPQVPAIRINEWMADNTSASGIADPADGKFDDWFELYNAGGVAVNLGGYFLTDTSANKAQYPIPAGTTLPAGGYLLVWADGETAQNGLTAGQLHANFKLSADGEQIGLYTPDGTQVDLVTFAAQGAVQSSGRYPDGTSGITPAVPTPGTRNALSPQIVSFKDLGATTSRFTFTTEPTHVYRLEYCTELGAWSPFGVDFTATATSTSMDLPRTGAKGFWRARLVVP